jgi:hypothetical protein
MPFVCAVLAGMVFGGVLGTVKVIILNRITRR